MNTTTSNEQEVLATGRAPHYVKIVSQAHNAQGLNLFITAAPDGKATVYTELDDDSQLWFKKLMRKESGAYALVNKKHGTCIKRDASAQGAPLRMVDIEEAADKLALWLDDTVPSQHNAIQSFIDGEQKINIPGNGPYSAGAQLITWEWSRGKANELWLLQPA